MSMSRTILQPLSPSAKQVCVWHVCLHALTTCSGAVIVVLRKTGFVNFGVSRESGGAVRAPGNAGVKRVKRKRGNRSVAAVAARIERGYLKRTSSSTACVNNRVDSGGTGTHGSGHPAARRTSTTAGDGDDNTRTRKRKTLTASAEHGEHAKTARAGRRDRSIVDTELNANLGSEESGLSTQMYYILVITNARAALDKCHDAGVNEGFEAWRQFVMEWEPKLRTRYVGLLMQLGANPESKGKGKGKSNDIKGKDKAKDVKNDRPRKRKTERPSRGRGGTGGSIATFTRHSSGPAVTVLTPRRETLVNVCHSHALREQRNVLRVFQ